MEWKAGKKIKGYTIKRKLGEGGFGITYLATDTNGKKVVIKTPNFILQKQSNFEEIQNKFVDEAKRLQQCEHPNIVKYYKLFKEDNLWCIVMEYIEGENLATIVQRDGFLQEQEALKYIIQIGSALKLVHKKGILHRDIKPDNIIKRKNKPEVILIDFGIARDFTPNQSQSHTQYFTHGFAPIEQYVYRYSRGEYTDVYALAATLYVLLTGYHKTSQGIYYCYLPSANERANAIANRESDPLKSPKEINKYVSSQVSKAILKGMKFEHNKRPQTVAEWLNLFSSSVHNPLHNHLSQISQLVTVAVAPVNKKINTTAKKINISPWLIWGLSLISLPVLYYFAPTISGGLSELPPEVNYESLEKLLSNEKFEDADKETLQLMLTLAKRRGERWFNKESIQNISCDDLQTIDELWAEHSNGRFGFSIQKKIWKEVVNQPGLDEKSMKENFLDRIGWRVNGKLHKNVSYSLLSAPKGHLPHRVTSRIGKFGVPHIAERLTSCDKKDGSSAPVMTN